MRNSSEGVSDMRIAVRRNVPRPPRASSDSRSELHHSTISAARGNRRCLATGGIAAEAGKAPAAAGTRHNLAIELAIERVEVFEGATALGVDPGSGDVLSIVVGRGFKSGNMLVHSRSPKLFHWPCRQEGSHSDMTTAFTSV
jgi:hypothetical protein